MFLINLEISEYENAALVATDKLSGLKKRNVELQCEIDRLTALIRSLGRCVFWKEAYFSPKVMHSIKTFKQRASRTRKESE
jgi:hypothetical protein